VTEGVFILHESIAKAIFNIPHELLCGFIRSRSWVVYESWRILTFRGVENSLRHAFDDSSLLRSDLYSRIYGR